ncbi:MAG: hypothetical protein Q9220_001492 [cf. Caloplaca sp. 1 TL-2023]
MAEPPMEEHPGTNIPHPQDSSPEPTRPISPPTPTSPSSISSPPPHRSHSPTKNRKRSDPFQFGSRYLLPTDNPFEYNAWDHVLPTAEDLSTQSQKIASQRQSPVSAFDRARFNADPAKWWNRFYANNTANFFKDRKWLIQEFPVLGEVTQQGVGGKVVLEVGAGAGNSCFPILRGNRNEELEVWACDFSERAVQVIRSAEEFDERYLRAEVWDVASPVQHLPAGLEEGSVDVVLMVFVFSALHPGQWEQAVRNLWRALKPNGEVCFRDYGRGDLAQVRMKKGRWMEENFYIRGDGTRVYFFEQEELRGIWTGEAFRSDHKGCDGGEAQDGKRSREGENEVVDDAAATTTSTMADGETQQTADEMAGEEPAAEVGFEIVSLGVDRRMLVNRHKQLKMYRCWMQGRFRKPNNPTMLKDEEIQKNQHDIA